MGCRMPSEEKPYRLYRGGRIKGKVPGPTPDRPDAPRRTFKFKPNRSWWKAIPVVLAFVLLVVIVWALVSYFQFRDGVASANKRLDPRVERALDPQRGKATDILLLGTDHAQLAGRETAHRSDSITLVRVDTGKHRIAYLSIPRDLIVDIPGYGVSKINAAMQIGGPRRAVLTVRKLTGLPVNHIAV